MRSHHHGRDPAQVTRLLSAWKAGDANAMEMLTPIVYDELRRLAGHYLRDERNASTLQPTALVHEVYLRLVASELPDWESRAHFIGVAAHRMRQVLVEHARQVAAQKRGGGAARVELDDALNFAPERSRDVIALDDALSALGALDERKMKILELRFFGGFSVEETARAVGVSVATVGREQRMAEAWLRRELDQGTGNES